MAQQNRNANMDVDKWYWKATRSCIEVTAYDNKGKNYKKGDQSQTELFPAPMYSLSLPVGYIEHRSEENSRYITMDRNLLLSQDTETELDVFIFLDPGNADQRQCRHCIVHNRQNCHQTMATRATTSNKLAKHRISRYPKELRDKMKDCVRTKKYDYLDAEKKVVLYPFSRGHGIDYKDGTYDTTQAIENFSPQHRYYNQWVRGPTVQHQINADKVYIEIAIYSHSSNSPVTRNNTLIPGAFLFIHQDAANQKKAYYFPNLPKTHGSRDLFTERGFDYKDKKITNEYKRECANKRRNHEKPDSKYKFICSKLDISEQVNFDLLRFVYDDNMTDQDIMDFIENAKQKVEDIIENRFYAEKPLLRDFMVVQLMGQAATLEFNSINCGIQLLSMLTGIKNPYIASDINTIRTLFNMIIHKAFYHLHGLRTGLRRRIMSREIKALNGMNDLYWLLKNNYQSTQATIIRQIAISYMRDIYGLKCELTNGEYVIKGVYERIRPIGKIYKSFFKGSSRNPRMIYTEKDFRDYMSKEDLLHAYERNYRFM